MPRVAILLAAVLLLTAGCADGQVRRSGDGGQSRYIEGTGAVTTVPDGDRAPAPDFGGPLLDGGEFDLAEARGDVVVLNVWGSWCPPCSKEAPALQAVAESLAADGVRFVGINTRDNETDARAFQAEFGVTYPSVVDTDGRRMLAFRDTLPPAAIPTTLVIDRESRVAARGWARSPRRRFGT
jgi:thiol-disulfide isomerase/thioredoxin